MSSNNEDIIYENLQEISGSTSKYNANSAGIKKKNIVVKGRNNVSDTKTENVNVAANEDAIYGNSGNVVITSSKINIKCAKSNTVDIISVKKDTDDNEGEIYENLGFLQKPNERETHKDVTNGKITVYNNTNTENERSKDNIKKDLSKCLNEALAKRSHIVQHNITRYNEDDDQAIYDNTNFQESIPKVDNQLSLSNNVVVLEDDCAIYENTSLSEKVKDRKRENNLGAHHQGSTQRNGEFSNSSENRSLKMSVRRLTAKFESKTNHDNPVPNITLRSFLTNQCQISKFHLEHVILKDQNFELHNSTEPYIEKQKDIDKNAETIEKQQLNSRKMVTQDQDTTLTQPSSYVLRCKNMYDSKYNVDVSKENGKERSNIIRNNTGMSQKLSHGSNQTTNIGRVDVSSEVTRVPSSIRVDTRFKARLSQILNSRINSNDSNLNHNEKISDEHTDINDMSFYDIEEVPFKNWNYNSEENKLSKKSSENPKIIDLEVNRSNPPRNLSHRISAAPSIPFKILNAPPLPPRRSDAPLSPKIPGAALSGSKPNNFNSNLDQNQTLELNLAEEIELEDYEYGSVESIPSLNIRKQIVDNNTKVALPGYKKQSSNKGFEQHGLYKSLPNLNTSNKTQNYRNIPNVSEDVEIIGDRNIYSEQNLGSRRPVKSKKSIKGSKRNSTRRYINFPNTLGSTPNFTVSHNSSSIAKTDNYVIKKSSYRTTSSASASTQRRTYYNVSETSDSDSDAPPLPPRMPNFKKQNSNSPNFITPKRNSNCRKDTVSDISINDKHFSETVRKEKWNGYDQVEGSNYSDNGSDDYGEMMMKFRSPEDGHYFPDRSNEDFYDDFDSDSWDSEPEEINYIESFSANVTSNALPLKEILENKLFQNMDWSDIMTKLQFRFDDREKHLQNGKYQLVVAEWSFLKSMNILQDQFVDKLFILLSNNEKSKLFAYVKEVRDSSHNFMQDLEKCWVKNAFTDNFCEIIYNNLIASFEVYLQYTANQVYSEALLGEIISDKSRDFKDLLVEIQAEPKCNGLHLHAYQLTPIRKINSLPSLLQNIFKCLSPRDREYGFCKKSLDFLNELLSRCNTESKKSKDNLRTKTILEKLEFPRNTPFKMNNSGDIHMRTFIKSDKMELIEMNSTLFRKKINRKPVYIFLFNDIFVVARYRSSTGKYQVLDYTFRINIELDPEPELLHITYGIDISTILYLHIKENCDLKKIDMILSCETRTDVIRWNEALDPPDSGKINNYFDFNILKNVMVVCNYSAVHSDEISLTNGERFKILRETEDGWSFGQREKDGECGWFQTEYVVLLDNIQKKDNRSRHRLHK